MDPDVKSGETKAQLTLIFAAICFAKNQPIIYFICTLIVKTPTYTKTQKAVWHWILFYSIITVLKQALI